MEDVAQKITKRLDGDDKVKYETIFTMLHHAQKFGLDTNYYSEGEWLDEWLDAWIRVIIEHLEENVDLKKIDHKHFRGLDITSEFKKICEICELFENENMLNLEKLNKNSVKELLKRLERMDS